METKIQVQAKDVYGRILFYPLNEQAKRAAELTGKKTLTLEHLKILTAMGFTIEQQTVEVKL